MKVLLFTFTLIFSISTLGYGATLSVNDFMANPDIFDMDISPDGRYLAEVRQLGKIRTVIIRDLAASDLTVVGTIGDEVFRPYGVVWANDERLIVHLLVPDNAEKVRQKLGSEKNYDIDDNFMYRRSISVDPKGGNAVILMYDKKSLQYQTNLSRIRHLLPSDPLHILMNGYDKDRLSLYKVNVYNGSTEKVISGGSKTIYFICDSDGYPRYRVDYFKTGNMYKILEHVGENKWNVVDQIDFDKGDENSIDPNNLVGLSLKGKLVYRKKNKKTGFYEIIEKDRHSKDVKVIVSIENHDVTGLIYNYGNDQVIGYIYEEDHFVKKYFDSERQKFYESIHNKLNGYGFYIASSDRANNYSVIVVSGPDLPAAYYLYDHTKDNLIHYGDKYPRLKSIDVGTGASTTFFSRDGVPIRMYLILPPDYKPGGKYPLVIMPHGGPQARDYNTYNDFAAFIASQGYLVARPNFRGSTGYGLKFEEAGYKQWGGIMQDDLQDAAQFLIHKGYVKDGNICLVGGSYGGYAALMGTIKHQNFYRCAVSINGVTHLRNQLASDKKRFKHHPELLEQLHITIGDPKADAELLDANSPLIQVAKINSPVLLIAGARDERVPFKQSSAMVKALKKAKKSVEWIPMKNAYHNAFYYQEDRKIIYENVSNFLSKHLNQPSMKQK